jgi:carbamate kinase
MESKSRLALIAIGGNSLIVDERHKTVADQYHAVEDTVRHLAALLKQGYRLVITHGNGPQVGFILRRSELSRFELHEVPLDSCGADTQGAIGYQIQMALHNEMRSWTEKPSIATVVTQTLVDRFDLSFTAPTKPIGSFMTEAAAREHEAKDGWRIAEDAGRGWRRLVASPEPRRIIELDIIQRLVDGGVVVVAAGGGGIPVVKQDDGALHGVDAVIDKDLASSLLASALGADVFAISTGVEKVCVNYRKPDERPLSRISAAEAKRYLAEGQFAAGSMKPKVEAVVRFVEGGGREALITDPKHLLAAFAGQAGTWIVP